MWVRLLIIPFLDTVREYAILLFRPYLAVYRLKGQGKGGPVTLTYAVSGADSDFKSYLKNILFVEAEPVEEETVQNLPFWRLRKLIDDSTTDITFIGGGKSLIRRLPSRKAIIMPRSVDQILNIKGEWKDVLARFHTTVRRNELRLIRKYGYETEISDKDTDFEMFFYAMYLPSMKERHGYQAHLKSYAVAYQRFKRGLLFLTKQGDTYVSGGLCDTRSEPGIVHFLLTGVMNANQQLIKVGAQSALYYAIAQWAYDHNYEAVDFEAAEPFLKKGILQHKRKWGMAARIPPNAYKQLWLKIQRHTPAVDQFLKDNPCIMINERGDLQGLFFADDPDQVPAETKAEWDKLCAMPGLNGYRICSVEDLVQAW